MSTTAAPVGAPASAPSAGPASPASGAKGTTPSAPGGTAPVDPTATKAAEPDWHYVDDKGQKYTKDHVRRWQEQARGAEKVVQRSRAAEQSAAELKESLKTKGVRALIERATDLGLTPQQIDTQIEEYLLERAQREHEWEADPADPARGQWKPKTKEQIELDQLREFKKSSETQAKERAAKAASERARMERERDAKALSDEVLPILTELGYDPEMGETVVLPFVAQTLLAANEIDRQIDTKTAALETRERIDAFTGKTLEARTKPEFLRVVKPALDRHLSSMTGAEIEEFIGKEAIKTLFKHTLGKSTQPVVAPRPDATPAARTPPRRLASDEEQERLGRAFGGARR